MIEDTNRAASTLEAYEELGNTFLYIASIGQAANLYDRFPSLIKLVLASKADVQACVKFGNEEHATLLDEEDIKLGGRVIGYQFDRLTGSGTVRISNEDLEKRKIDVFSRQWEAESRIRPYGFQSLDPKSSPEDDVITSDARVTCVRQATDDSEGIPIWKLFEWRPRGEVSTDEVSLMAGGDIGFVLMSLGIDRSCTRGFAATGGSVSSKLDSRELSPRCAYLRSSGGLSQN